MLVYFLTSRKNIKISELLVATIVGLDNQNHFLILIIITSGNFFRYMLI